MESENRFSLEKFDPEVLGFETKFAHNLMFNIDFDYALKFIGTKNETNSNSFIKASFNYIME